MNKMQQEYDKAMTFLKEEWSKLSPQEKNSITINGINGLWVRNESGLWESYEECQDFILNGIDYNPLHPDNLSAMVIEDFMNSEMVIEDFMKEITK